MILRLDYLETRFIDGVLNGTPIDYEGIYTPTMTAKEILKISEKLELKY